MARKLSDIGDKWEALGTYLNIDKNRLFKIYLKHTKTKSKVFAVLKIWRKKTPDASRSQLKHIISAFTATVSRRMSSLSTCSKCSYYNIIILFF